MNVGKAPLRVVANLLKTNTTVSAGSNLVKNVTSSLLNNARDDQSKKGVRSMTGIRASESGTWSSNVTKTQNVQQPKDAEKYKAIYENLSDEQSKVKFNSLSKEDKDAISNIWEKSQSVISDFPDDKRIEKKKMFSNNLIEIFNNDEYSKFKDTFHLMIKKPILFDIDKINCFFYQLSDIKAFKEKANITENGNFLTKAYEFSLIMKTIESTQFENEETKKQVKEYLFELCNDENSNLISLSEQNIKTIIKLYKMPLDEQSKRELDNLPIEDKKKILNIWEQNKSVISYFPDDKQTEKGEMFLNNLIEIFKNNEYSDLKKYLDDMNLRNCLFYQLSDLKAFKEKTNMSYENKDFFAIQVKNFMTIMKSIESTQFESEETKKQVKEYLFELCNDANSNLINLSEQNIKPIINSYKILSDEQLKAELDRLPKENKEKILNIWEQNKSVILYFPEDKQTEKGKMFLNNLIEIFKNNEYSDLKKYLDDMNLRNCLFYQLSDIKAFKEKTNMSYENKDSFATQANHFITIMKSIESTQFENEETKEQVKKCLFKLYKDKNLKSNSSLFERDITSVIKFLTAKNKKIGDNSINSKMEILNKLNLFNNNGGEASCGYYNVEDRLDIFNTFVDLIPEGKNFDNCKDKIIKCVNSCADTILKANDFLKKILKPNLGTIKESNNYETILDKMIQFPYSECQNPELYCEVIFDKDNKYKCTTNKSHLILNLIMSETRMHTGEGKYAVSEFNKLYEKYNPMLEKFDEKNLSKIDPLILDSLYKLYEISESIQVNDEEISLQRLSLTQIQKLQSWIKDNKSNLLLQDINIKMISEKLDKIFIKDDIGHINYAATLYEINDILSPSHLNSPEGKMKLNDILTVKDGLADINFGQIVIEKTNNFENLKLKVKEILSQDNTISEDNQNFILEKLTNNIDSMMFNKLPLELEGHEVIKQIRNEIDNYLSFKEVEGKENTYTIGNVKISGMDANAKQALEHIFKAIPELVVLLGISQAGHGFDLGKHILAVGKEVVKNNKFQNLSEGNQKLVLIAALMHDIAKNEGGNDPLHPQKGSQYAYKVLNDVLNEDDKTTVANLVFNHHFGAYMAKSDNLYKELYAIKNSPGFMDNYNKYEIYAQAYSKFQTADTEYENARYNYNQACSKFQTADTEYENARYNYNQAYSKYQTAGTEYEKAVKNYVQIVLHAQETDTKQEVLENYTQAKSNYQEAGIEYENACYNYNQAYSKYQAADTAYKEAWEKYTQAKSNYQTADTAYKEAWDNYNSQVNYKQKQDIQNYLNKYQEWSYNYNGVTLQYECKDTNPAFMDMLQILGEADLTGDDESYKTKTEQYFNEIPGRISSLQQSIQSVDTIIKGLKDQLYITPFPKRTIEMTGGELPNDDETMRECQEKEIIGTFTSKRGHEVTKIDLTKMATLSDDQKQKYLKFLGFGENVEYNNLEFLIHAIDNDQHVEGIKSLTSEFKSDATLSTSIITMANTKMYCNRKYGFIMDPDKTTILFAWIGNIGSGYRKGRAQSGHYINETKNLLNNENNNALLKNYIQSSRKEKQNGHSELITVDNKVAAIFVKAGHENEMPEQLVKFANERKLPLIIIPDDQG